MSWLQITLIVCVTLAVMAALIYVASLADRSLAALNPIVDRWRPTNQGEARPGHETLVAGVVLLAGSIGALVWYDLGPVVADLPRSLEGVPLQSVLSLAFVAVILPAAGLWCVLSWKCRRLEREKNLIRLTSAFGHQTEWMQFMSASVDPYTRRPGAVWFEIAGNRWIRAFTDWVNIRELYEALSEVGVKSEPWPQKDTRGFWSR